MTEFYLFLESKEWHLSGCCGHVTCRWKPSIFVSQIRYASPVRLCHLVLVVEFHRTMSQTYLSSCEKSSLASVWNSLNSYLRWNISMNPRDVFSAFAFGAFCLAKLTAKPLLHPFLPYWRENTAHVRWLVVHRSCECIVVVVWPHTQEFIVIAIVIVIFTGVWPRLKASLCLVFFSGAINL